MAFTNSGATQILNALTGKSSSATLLSNCYMALSTTQPNADGTGVTEPAASTGYARALIGMSNQSATQKMGTPTNGTIANSEIIFFPEITNAPSPGVTVTYFALYPSATGGTPILYGAISPSVTLLTGYVPLFRVGNFSLTLS